MRIDTHKTRTRLTNVLQRMPSSRRLVMPELLESRNAPGALLPLPIFWSAFDGDVQDAGQPLADDLSRQAEEQTYYRSDLISPLSPVYLSVENMTNTFRDAVANDLPTQVKIATTRQATEFRTPRQLVAINTAFESFSLNDLNSVPINPQLPPPVIQPVEPTDDQPQNESDLSGDLQKGTGMTSPTTTDPATQTPPLVTQPVIMDPASEHNQPTGEPENVTPPQVIQPVITDPESEHNQPHSEAETPPPLIQPVIMDPESEHNQE